MLKCNTTTVLSPEDTVQVDTVLVQQDGDSQFQPTLHLHKQTIFIINLCATKLNEHLHFQFHACISTGTKILGLNVTQQPNDNRQPSVSDS